MKKENIFGLLMYLVIFALAVVYGLTVLQSHFEHSSFNQIWQYALYIIISIVAGLLISAFLTEIGHLVGAKVGGYKILKFTVLYLSFYKDGEKWKFGFKKFDGLTGETTVVPNYEKKEKPNPIPYLIYGPLFNLAWFVGSLFLFFYFNDGTAINGDIAYGILTAGLIAVVIALYDIIPVKTDVITSGYYLAAIIKAKNTQVFNDITLAKYKADYGDETVVIKEAKVEPVVDVDSAEGKVVKLYDLIDNKQYADASILVEEILQDPESINRRLYLEVQEHQMYLKIMSTPYEEMSKYYFEEVPMSLKREVASDNTIIAVRTYLLMAGLFDKARGECLVALGKLAKAYKNTPKNRKHSELVLFNEALEKVCSAHPKWELEIYKLYE